MNRRMLIFVPLIVLFTLMSPACASKGGGSTSGTHASGDPVEVKEKSLVITMVSGSVSSYKVITTFTIENKGTGDFAIDPKTTFTASATSGDEKVPLSLGVLECGSKLIKGPVPAGGKITGDMCWRGDPTNTWPTEVVISFGGAATDPGAAVWKLSATQ